MSKPLSSSLEMEQIQYKQNKATDESLASTRRMLQLCSEAKEAAIKTVVSLDDQADKLDNVENGLMSIHQDMKEAKESLAGLGKSISWKPKKEEDKVWKNKEDGKVDGSCQIQRRDGPPLAPYGGYIPKYTNDGRENEMENNLQEVSATIGNLRNMALDIRQEIVTQNHQIDRLNNKAEIDQGQLQGANKLAKKLLK